MPDFGTYFTASEPDRERLVRRMIRAISSFEPRLKKVGVSIEPVRVNEKTLTIVIDAIIVVDTVRVPVSFLTVYQDRTGTMDIYENR